MKRLFVCLTLLIMTFALTLTPRSANAASYGCEGLASMSSTHPVGSGGGVFSQYHAGEVVTIVATLNTATNAVVRLYGSLPGDPNETLVGPTPVPGTLTFTIPTTGNRLIGFEVVSGDGTVDLQISCDLPAASGGKLLFTDGRVNPEAGATVVAYCNKPERGDIQVYAIYQSKGYFAFTATKAEIEAVPTKPAVNTLIKQALGAQLWRLANGNLEIRRGADGDKIYAYQWKGC